MAKPRSSAAAQPPGARHVLLRGSALWLAALLSGCGARALVDASPGEEEIGTSGASAEGGAGGRGGSGAGGLGAAPTVDPAEPIDLGGVVLPDCEPGFSISAAGARECTYLYRDDCYEDPLSACACACQSLADNRGCIIGGFLNPDSPQTVSCIQR
jgi:hypothetical protein